MKIKILCTRVECGTSVWSKGEIVTGRPRDLQPLIDGGFAELADEAAKQAKKPAKEA